MTRLGAVPFLAAMVCVSVALPCEAQRTADEAVAALARLKTQLTRGEFETSEEYAARQNRVRGQLVQLLSGAYSTSGPVSFGFYNADAQTMPVQFTLPGRAEQLVLRVPPAEARQLKDAGQNARGTGSCWIEIDGNAFLIGRLRISLGGKTYQTEPAPSGVQIPAWPREVIDLTRLRLGSRGAAADAALLSPTGRFIAPYDGGDVYGPRGDGVILTSGGQEMEPFECSWFAFTFDDAFFACSTRSTTRAQSRCMGSAV